jgi:hypothetical protein
VKGRAIPLSPARRLVVEHCRLAQDVPRGTMSGWLEVGPLMAARAACGPARPPWTAIFAKAMALAAAEMPELRRVYARLPRPHLYEVPHSVAAVVVERHLGGEAGLFYGRLKAPERTPLPTLAARIREAKEAPVEGVKDYRTALLVARLPAPLRRLAFWVGRNWGRQAPNHFGTFGISVVAEAGVEIIAPVAHWTSFLTYGPIGSDGRVRAYITFDHRVMDGGGAAQALRLLGEALAGPVLAELRAMAEAGPAGAVRPPPPPRPAAREAA